MISICKFLTKNILRITCRTLHVIMQSPLSWLEKLFSKYSFHASFITFAFPNDFLQTDVNQRSPFLQEESLKLSCPSRGTPHDIYPSSQTAKSTHLQRASWLELWHCGLTQQWNCLPWFGHLILTVILRRIGFLWPLGVDVAQREYKLPWIMLFLHNRCNFSDAFSAIVSFSQIFRLFRGWNGGIWNQRSIISVCTISYNCSTSEGVVLTKLQMLH